MWAQYRRIIRYRFSRSIATPSPRSTVHDSLRSEIIHDKLNVPLTVVDLPAVKTPQFDWAMNKMGKKAMLVPPIYQPKVPARAIFFA